MTLTEYVKGLSTDVEYIVVLDKSTHWIFDLRIEDISTKWSDTKTITVVSEKDYSVVVRVV